MKIIRKLKNDNSKFKRLALKADTKKESMKIQKTKWELGH